MTASEHAPNTTCRRTTAGRESPPAAPGFRVMDPDPLSRHTAVDASRSVGSRSAVNPGRVGWEVGA